MNLVAVNAGLILEFECPYKKMSAGFSRKKAIFNDC